MAAHYLTSQFQPCQPTTYMYDLRLYKMQLTYYYVSSPDIYDLKYIRYFNTVGTNTVQ